jgi:hypothetical protein
MRAGQAQRLWRWARSMVGRDARRHQGHGPAGAGFAAGLDPASLCRDRTADSDDPATLVTFTGDGSNQDQAFLLASRTFGWPASAQERRMAA